MYQPAKQEIFAGEDVTSVSEVSYQWYDIDGMVTNGGNISGAQMSTLTVAGSKVADENVFYSKATNTAGTITSSSAVLRIKRLVGYWDLNDPGTADPNDLWIDLSESDNNHEATYTVPDTFV